MSKSSRPSQNLQPNNQLSIVNPPPDARRITRDDISLHAGERGLLIGMTRYGKSTLAEKIIEWFREDYSNARIIIFDTKPRFKATHELNGLSAAWRYRQWDYGALIPESVVIPLRDPSNELKVAWSLGFHVVIAQIHKRSDIMLLDAVGQAAYSDRKKGVPLLKYYDETNNFFRTRNSSATIGLTQSITSGGEKSISVLLAAQRPRWIGVEAMESMTKLWWFHTPYKDDKKHLKDMGIPEDAQPPGVNQKYVFYFFDRNTGRVGVSTLNLKKKGKP